MSESENNNTDAEISLLFNDAITKLDKIDAEAKQEKKQIIIQLAKDLERKIRTDTISIEIVNQLRGRVSERFIHNCLEEKYKQKRQVENARKQKKKEQETAGVENLAVIPPLNQEDEKKAITVDNDGREGMIASSPPAKQQDPKSVESRTQDGNGSQNIQKEKSLDIGVEKDGRLMQLKDKLKEYEERNEKLQEDLRRRQVIIVRISLCECKKIVKLMGIPPDIFDNVEESATDIYAVIDGEEIWMIMDHYPTMDELEEMGLPI
ncbi:MAG: hypothetical protein JO297_05670 [Nitrososphaeraceae archaeon]|nr:hypothetical protein [Nitrososphaeraceae archaeon]